MESAHRMLQVGMVEQHIGSNPGNDNNDGDQNLQISTKNQSLLGFLQVLSGQTFLNDVLVKAPVTQIGQPHGTKNNRQSRKILKRSVEHTSELQSRPHLVCRLLLEKKKQKSTQ